ncbi:MAG: hypothetical protein K0R23_276 [Lacrimispora sp.]|jgi:hypothetical protein|nr:hypothetical protein [Lacrimispora sp.]
MKYDCDVIKDLLPLYQDGACSEMTKQIVSEHLQECETCNRVDKLLKNTAYDDMLIKDSQTILKNYVKQERRYSFTIGILAAGILMIPLIVCLILNLAIGHVLDWFFIVLTSLMVVSSFAVIPFITTRYRFAKTVLSFTISLILLLLTCCIYTKGDWFWCASTSSVFGIVIVCLPIILHLWDSDRWATRNKGLLCMIIDTVLLYAVIFVCGIYADIAGYWRISFLITTGYAALIWLLFLIIRYLKCNAVNKTGLCMILIGISASGSNEFIGYILHDPGVSNNVLNYVIGIIIAGIGLVACVVGGCIKKKNS